VLHVGDNGVGGADPDRGTGLRGLADRVEALGGKLELSSPAGQGTTLTASIPCELEPRLSPQVPVSSATRAQQPRLA